MCPLTGKGRPTVPSIKWARSQCDLRTQGKRSRPGWGGRLQALGGEAGCSSLHLQFCRPGSSSHRQGLASRSHKAWRATLRFARCVRCLLAGSTGLGAGHRLQLPPAAGLLFPSLSLPLSLVPWFWLPTGMSSLAVPASKKHVAYSRGTGGASLPSWPWVGRWQ